MPSLPLVLDQSIRRSKIVDDLRPIRGSLVQEEYILNIFRGFKLARIGKMARHNNSLRLVFIALSDWPCLYQIRKLQMKTQKVGWVDFTKFWPTTIIYGFYIGNEFIFVLRSDWPRTHLSQLVYELGKAIFAFLVATLSYFAETGINPDFESIPDAMWWSFITISTIGYGDVVPMTHMGKCKQCF